MIHDRRPTARLGQAGHLPFLEPLQPAGGAAMLPVSQLQVASYEAERQAEARAARQRRQAARGRPDAEPGRIVRSLVGTVLVRIGTMILPPEDRGRAAA